MDDDTDAVVGDAEHVAAARVGDEDKSESAAEVDADALVPALSVHASPVVVVDSWESNTPGPELESATVAEGLWLLSTDVLARQLAAQLGLEEDASKQLEEAVQTEDVKSVLVRALSRKMRAPALRPADVCIDTVSKDAERQRVGATADHSEQAVEPLSSHSCWTKFRGVDGYAPVPIPAWHHVLGSGLTSFLGLGAICSSRASPAALPVGTTGLLSIHVASVRAALLSFVHYGLTQDSLYTSLLGSFGANAVLMFAAPAAPFSQPRNVMGGHLIGAVCGVAAQKWVTGPMGTPSIGVPVAVSSAIMGMAATGTTHPPGGGTAFIAAMALQGDVLAEHGWAMVATATLGAALLVLAAALLNNALPDRRYPQGWH